MTTDLDGEELGRVLAASGGFVAFALWNLMFRLAATCSRRGVLVQNGLPLTVVDLARLAHFPANLIQPALELLASPEIGLIERVPLGQALVPPDIPEPLPRKPKIQPFRQCPVCNADLTEYYQLATVEKGSGTDCQNGPTGALHNRYLTPFQQSQGGLGSLKQGERSDSEAAGLAAGCSTKTSNSLRSPGIENPCHPAVNKPRPSWLKPPTLRRTTSEEIETVKRGFENGEFTAQDVADYIDTHYYDPGHEDDEGNDDWDEAFLEDLLPPEKRRWG